MAEVPQRIERILWNKEYNKQGAFRFYFWVKDGWYGINIDDRIPTKKYGSRYRPFASYPSTAGAWWLPLLEKAYAKLDQNYDRIVAGWGQEGLRTLTGMPTYNYRFEGAGGYNLYSKEVLLPMHKYFAERNYPMTSGCCRNNGHMTGLISGHAYSLLDVREIDYTGPEINGTKLWLAKMRNPWNNEHYKGPFRDDDPRWTDALKEELGWENSNDGIFWMPYDAYFMHFENTGVAFYDKYEAYE